MLCVRNRKLYEYTCQYIINQFFVNYIPVGDGLLVVLWRISTTRLRSASLGMARPCQDWLTLWLISITVQELGQYPYLPTLPIFAGDSRFHCPLPVSSWGHISPAFLPISDKIRFTQDCFHSDFNTATPLFGFHGSVALFWKIA